MGKQNYTPKRGGQTYSNNASMYYGILGSKEAVGNLPKFKPVGSAFERSTLDFGSSNNTLPMLEVFHYVNTFGDTRAFNVALSKLQTSLRARNSRIGEYEPGDLGQVLIAGTDVYYQLNVLAFAIYAAQTFDANKYCLGDMIIAACHFNVADFRENLAKYKDAYVQLSALAMESIYIPVGFYYFERKLALSSAIFCDDHTDTSQVFMFTCDHYLQYDEANGMVVPYQSNVQGTGRTFMMFKSQIEAQINNLVYSAALTTMWADIKGACDAFYTLSPIALDGKLTITVVPEQLTTILNAEMAQIPATNNATSITTAEVHNINNAGEGNILACLAPNINSLYLKQDSDGLLFQGISALNVGPCWNTTAINGTTVITCRNGNKWRLPCGEFEHVLNFYSDEVDADDLMLATRFMFNYAEDPGLQQVTVTACGTEILTARDYYYIDGGITSVKHVIAGGLLSSTTTNIVNNASDIAVLIKDAAFDWSPQFFISVPVDDGDGFKIPALSTMRRFFYPGKVIPISTENLSEMHRLAIQSIMRIESLK